MHLQRMVSHRDARHDDTHGTYLIWHKEVLLNNVSIGLLSCEENMI
jgi:hypothetical protein